MSPAHSDGPPARGDSHARDPAHLRRDRAARIRSGEHQPGERLPSYKGISELYSVSFSTAARSVALLRDRGLVVGAPGRGVFVADPKSSR
ncbi:GntR family transcriptional regulator [Solwaraspora sp. WMMD1047]|nr:GntR family transcriptional regulator [Solwaraspora sp. WMMD1047]MDG4829480.1 GntR family transcriptional regulator [Solwaraspora sp. WMMD1047]